VPDVMKRKGRGPAAPGRRCDTRCAEAREGAVGAPVVRKEFHALGYPFLDEGAGQTGANPFRPRHRCARFPIGAGRVEGWTRGATAEGAIPAPVAQPYPWGGTAGGDGGVAWKCRDPLPFGNQCPPALHRLRQPRQPEAKSPFRNANRMRLLSYPPGFPLGKDRVKPLARFMPRTTIPPADPRPGSCPAASYYP